MKLLLAEDTQDLNRAVSAILQAQGYEVTSTFDGAEALERIMQEGYDGIILDIMMPKMNGLDVLKTIRARGIITPVLLLTAKTEIDDRVNGLDAGADDYLPKPFAMKELMARVRSMTRRRTAYSRESMTFSDITINAEQLELSAKNSIRLTLKEVELLQALVLNAGRELTTEYLLGQVWASEPDASADTVYLYVSYLRGKLRSVGAHAKIEGAHGGAYMLVETQGE